MKIITRKEFESFLQSYIDIYNMTDVEIDLIRYLVLSRKTLAHVQECICEFEFYKVMRGLKKDKEKMYLLSKVIESIEENRVIVEG
jgi:hypothetical protein